MMQIDCGLHLTVDNFLMPARAQVWPPTTRIDVDLRHVQRLVEVVQGESVPPIRGCRTR